MRGLALLVYIQMDIILCFMRGFALFASNGCQSVSCEGLHCLLVYTKINVNMCFMRGLALFASLHSNGCQSVSCKGHAWFGA